LVRIGRLDIDEAMRVEVGAQRAGDLVAQPQVVEHLRAAQVEIAIAQPQVLAGRLVMVERRRLAAIEHREAARHELDLAGRQRRVCGALGAPADYAGDLQHELRADALGQREGGAVVRD
jgi:hypothetical protein